MQGVAVRTTLGLPTYSDYVRSVKFLCPSRITTVPTSNN